jgi:uncharacterized membrane protein
MISIIYFNTINCEVIHKIVMNFIIKRESTIEKCTYIYNFVLIKLKLLIMRIMILLRYQKQIPENSINN